MAIWIAGATVGTAVFSGVMAKKAGDKASKAQGAATAATAENQKEQLDFAYEQYDEQLARYDEWRAIYGPIEENLGEFYNNLSPETFATAGLEYNAGEFQKQRTQMQQSLEQRGLGTSGITAAVDTQMGVAKAKADAQTRRDAPFKVAAEKSKFLAAGKGGPTQAPTGDVGNVLANSGVPGSLQGEANIASANSSSLWGSAGSLLSTGLNYGARNYQPTANQGAAKVDTGSMSLDPNPNARINLG